MEKALSLVEYKIKALKKDIDTNTTDGKISFLNKAADLLSKIDNNMEREMYIKKMSKEYEISQESIYAEVLKRIKPAKGFKTVSRIDRNRLKNMRKKGNSEFEKVIECERILLCVLSINNSVYRVIKDRLNPEDFEDEKDREIAKEVFSRLENNRGIVPAELINLVGDGLSDIFARLIQGECNFDDDKKAVMDIIRRMEMYRLDKREKEILELLSTSQNHSDENIEKLKQELNSILLEKKNK